jgi:hypothetical protein
MKANLSINERKNYIRNIILKKADKTSAKCSILPPSKQDIQDQTSGYIRLPQKHTNNLLLCPVAVGIIFMLKKDV